MSQVGWRRQPYTGRLPVSLRASESRNAHFQPGHELRFDRANHGDQRLVATDIHGNGMQPP